MQIGLLDVTIFWGICVDVGVMIFNCFGGEERRWASKAGLAYWNIKLALDRGIWVEDDDIVFVIGVASNCELIVLS